MWLLFLAACLACTRGVPWSHDAGRPFDGGAPATPEFPPLTRDATAPDHGQSDRPLPPRAWHESQRFPPLSEFVGSYRAVALAVPSDGLPCMVASTQRGLEFACLEPVVVQDAGQVPDGASDGPAVVWRRETLGDHPGGGWLGHELALVFDDQQQPWAVARQIPSNNLHLFWRDHEGWQRDEIPLPKAGFDPHLHWQHDRLWLSTGSQATHEAPRLSFSRRDPDGSWHHRTLVEGFDDLPGRYHDSLMTETRVQFCAYHPSAHRITWGGVDLRAIPLTLDAGNTTNSDVQSPRDANTTGPGDAGPSGDARTIRPRDAHVPSDAQSDGPPPPDLLEAQVGGPWCALSRHGRGLYFNTTLNGPIARLERDGRRVQTGQQGPFARVSVNDTDWLLSHHDGQLWMGNAAHPAFALGPLAGHHRPVAANYGAGVVAWVEDEDEDQLRLVVWEQQP